MQYTPKDVARFWDKVEKTEGCWLWTAARQARGMRYGVFGAGGKTFSAHRFSYALNVGPIPDAAHVLHRCDNPICVRPAHLFLGDHAINNADMRDKGRSARKLNPERVIEIRRSNLPSRVLAEKYGVSQHMIMRVLHRKAWMHIA